MADDVRATTTLARRLAAYEEMARAAPMEDGLGAVLASLCRQVDGRAGVIDVHGNVLASVPARVTWPIAELLAAPAGDGPAAHGYASRPLRLGSDVVALLFLRPASGPPDDDVLDFAAALLTSHLARLQAAAAGRRELAGQVFADVLRSALPDELAARRLRTFGVDASVANHVIVGHAGVAGGHRLRAVAWNLSALLSDIDEPFFRATVDEGIVSIVSSESAADAVARFVARELEGVSPQASVGIGCHHAGVAGLRVSYFEAMQSVRRGPGIHGPEPLDLASYVEVAGADAIMRDLAFHALQPLREHDRQRHSDLIATLRAYLDADATVEEAGRRLHVHPNTVRYRLRLIESISGLSLSSFRTRAHFWLALVSESRAVQS
jgi:purine catabolism regulator